MLRGQFKDTLDQCNVGDFCLARIVNDPPHPDSHQSLNANFTKPTYFKITHRKIPPAAQEQFQLPDETHPVYLRVR